MESGEIKHHKRNLSHMKTTLQVLIFSTLLLAGCNGNKSIPEEETSSEAMLELKAPPMEDNIVSKASVPDSPIDTSKKIVKTGNISFETVDVKSTRQAIFGITKKYGGYIAGENESGYENGRKNYTINLKVPAKNFDSLLQEISNSADKVDSKNIEIKDITTTYIDTKTRLQNKKLLEIRYLELLKKASKISDMLAIEDKLSEIRSDIESVESQFIQMQNQVTYSSLDLTFYSKSIAEETGKDFFYKVGRSLISGWEFMLSLLLGLLSFWPLAII
ncbi:MAG TPA: DUF4349 domain-containing protein, partial [Pedobacter sp.]